MHGIQVLAVGTTEASPHNHIRHDREQCDRQEHTLRSKRPGSRDAVEHLEGQVDRCERKGGQQRRWIKVVAPFQPGPEETDPRGLLEDRKSTRLNSSHANISYAVFCLKKKISYSIVVK